MVHMRIQLAHKQPNAIMRHNNLNSSAFTRIHSFQTTLQNFFFFKKKGVKKIDIYTRVVYLILKSMSWEKRMTYRLAVKSRCKA